MAESTRLSTGQVRAAMRLVRGCRERWADATAWRQHLLKGLRTLLESQVAMCVEGGGMDEQGRPQHIELATAGWPNRAARKTFIDYLEMGGPAMMPDFPVVARNIARHGAYTTFRRRHVPDSTWYNAPVYRQYHEPIHLDDYAVHMQAMPWLGTTCSLSVHRLTDAPPLGRRHARLLQIFGEELVPGVGRELCLKRQRGLHGLTARQRQTLVRLQQGDSEKQIAQRLGIGKNTVHDFVRELYHYFAVHSRGELLAYFINRRPLPTPTQLRHNS